MIKTVISIDGMSCGMCEAHINDVIRKNFDVKSVKSSAKKKESVVISQTAIDEEKLRKSIDETGYKVLEVSSEEYVKKGLFR